MAVVQSTVSTHTVDSAIGPIMVTIEKVTGFDVDDHVQTTVQSVAISIQMYNLAANVNTQSAKNRRIVSVGGITVGGY